MMDDNNRTISVQHQHYVSDVKDKRDEFDDNDDEFEVVYNINLKIPTLRHLLIFKSLYNCSTNN
jgi:hypothetical protein